MKVNSIRSTRGYPRQISLQSTKASNKPLCFHDFGRIPLRQLQQDLLAHRDSHPQHAVKHNALRICCFFLLLTAKSIHRQDIVTSSLQSLVWSQAEGHALLWHIHFFGLTSTLGNSSNAYSDAQQEPGAKGEGTSESISVHPTGGRLWRDRARTARM